ncbi:MAG: hypothetical protein BWY45_02879 [Euryarchaeota archaeon ADurb.Bin294]|nr:MAG: hypothetical protein BWY45_02879 [Euryarchaeota archaeon ADurb.Bin294]
MTDYSTTPGYSGSSYFVQCPNRKCRMIIQRRDINPLTARVECPHCHNIFTAYHHILEVED